MNDPVADMLTRIRNALMRNKSSVTMPYSRIKEQIAQIFLQSQFIVAVSTGNVATKKSRHKTLTLVLTNDERPISPISQLQRLSKPGRRVYVGHHLIPRVKSGRGLVILSTDQGLMTDRQARQKKLGGEVLCSIY